ncbi:DUF2953 domain-containing protein [Bacillus sp. FJAT-27245]|uniref:DUF2953 domain-containing protein n=1 Tax=Bacillus sp. FJAT-27245 TaxID=1684144 RepID=UPI0006A7A1F6|nr:DUF2953 domain-containing protein [Bacillus sp. FJAT-27245]
MAWVLALICGVILLLLASILLFMNITITACFRSHGGTNELAIECKTFFGLLKYKKTIPDLTGLFAEQLEDGIKVEKGSGNGKPREKQTVESLLKGMKDGKETLEKLLGTYKELKGFLKSVTVRRFEWSTAAGAGDAALTGIAAGAIWAAKGMAIGLLSEIVTLKADPAIHVTPYFQYRVAATMLSCMFTFRAGKAISAGIKIYKYVKRARRGQIPNGMPFDFD